MNWTRSAVALVGVTALATATAATAMAAPGNTSGNNGRHQVSKAPAWVGAAKSAAAPAAAQAHVKVWLSGRDLAGLKQLATDVSNPSSASYGAFLTPEQYDARFAPTTDTVAAVSAWLTSVGLSVDAVGSDNHYLSVSGTTAAMSNAFTAGLKTFTVAGHTGTAPTSAVTIPDAIAGAVTAVTGLDMVTHWVTPANSTGNGKDTQGDLASSATTAGPADLGPAPGFVNAGPCSAYYGQKVDKTDPAFQGKNLPYAVCGYTPSQFRSAYGVTASGRSGKGSTIAITDAFASPTLKSDADTYAKRQGDKKFRGNQFTQRNNTAYDPARVEACGGNGWYGEQSLDVEAAHGTAPDANIAYYGAASCYDDDLLAALATVVKDNKASIVSNSWGEPTYVTLDDGTVASTIDQSLVDAYDGIFAQGAVQGIGFYFSSGDDGDEVANTGVKSPDYPAADPWVTAVGGTSLAIDKKGNRQFETGWGTQKYTLTDGAWAANGYLYGAGGGCSDVFAQPFYQAGIVQGCAMRGVADVAMDGDPTTGMLVGQTQVYDLPNVWGKGTNYGEFRIGGTSLASPLFAGIQADAQQGRGRIGFANPAIYGLARKSSTYFDVTPQGDAGNVRVDYVNGFNAAGGLKTSIRTFNQDSSLPTAKGWDPVSGVGSPTRKYLTAWGGR